MNYVVVHLEPWVRQRPEDGGLFDLAALRVENGKVIDIFTCTAYADAASNLLSQAAGGDPLHHRAGACRTVAGVNCGVRDKVLPAAEALRAWLTFAAGGTWVGHRIDRMNAWLAHACAMWGVDAPDSAGMEAVDALDTWRLARILLPGVRDLTLSELARRLGISLTHERDALGKTRAVWAVLQALAEEAAQLPYSTLQQLTHLASHVSAAMAAWFAACAERRLLAHGTELPDGVEQVHQLAFSVPGATGRRADAEPGAAGDPDADWLSLARRLLDADSPLLSALPGFEVRPGQLQMVEAVAAALAEGHHLLVEAGTGVGKSLAYLIPAALYARARRERVVVATHTIALQDQIRDRDFPVLRKVLGEDVQLAVMKGRTHYVCLRKVRHETLAADLGTPREEVETLMALLRWLVVTPEGNREELLFHGALAEVWPRVQSETESCIGRRCPFFKPCYYFRARTRAAEADLVVTNHSLILSDLKADHRVLPKYDKLILDEAHHLEEEASRQLGESVHLRPCQALLQRLVRDGGHGALRELVQRFEAEARWPKLTAKLAAAAEGLQALRREVEAAFADLGELLPPAAGERRITAHVHQEAAFVRFEQRLADIAAWLEQLRPAFEHLGEAAREAQDEDLAARMLDARGFYEALSDHLAVLARATSRDPDWVVWLERVGPGPRDVRLHRTPVDVAGILADALFQQKDAVVMTSATLSAAGSFAFFKRQTGLAAMEEAGRVRELTVPSPFDYRRQAMLCIPNDVPELARMGLQDAAARLAESIHALAVASQGRLLVLFTSHAQLRATADAVRPRLAADGIALFAQGIDGPRSRLLAAFRHHPRAVLFGAQSFWEGIDLPGDELTTLVMVRLPFSPPNHPVAQARHERLAAAGQQPFWHLSLPEAVVRFRQGFGRLVRTIHDRGVVVIYDKRILTQRYGQAFLRALPGVRPYVAPEAEVIRSIRAFLTRPIPPGA
ncbi:DNA polymerase III subunit epsilon [Alicyclobacillus cellulosilyticus]|uniref:DNA 5'-3' helicase n=1 Tax=Alicyclobacillus cellulosilyticus TaxID=1003997 RepID=A0A917NKC7_9BACL|nr:helicase C-terminal domain-containing protein [Alicyclobacillus cellulosilyticus]GGJ07331.1 DNA polymerase III subunit epsilon [Alicyclobacillus cellulosilyticus]